MTVPHDPRPHDPGPDAPSHDAPGPAEPSGAGEATSPLDALRTLAVTHVGVADGFEHVEAYTMSGLLTLLCHGGPDLADVVLMCGGAMGGLLGPSDGLYHDLGVVLARRGIATIRVGYRRPGDLDRCTHDVLAAADFAARRGGRRFVVVGHSFGGAVAVNAGIALGDAAAGVVTLATQSAGCEGAHLLGATPLLLIHGDRDEILPSFVSEAVRELAGDGGPRELVVLPGDGHMLDRAAVPMRGRLLEWVADRFDARLNDKA